GHHHAQPRTMRKNRFSALTVINPTSGEISTNRNADDDWTFEGSVRTPAKHAEFIPQLHHRRPDVVEELNFRDGLQSTRGHADRPADNAGLCERRIKDAIVAKLTLQSGGGLKNAAL